MLILLVMPILLTIAAPIPPNDNLDVVTSSRRADSAVASAPAIAGNVTELYINASFITQSWQGYYGNIYGTIVLDDARNMSLYTWTLLSPMGRIYATRNSTALNWSKSNIICANITHIESEETELNFNLNGMQDSDGINETFRFITHPRFNVSTKGFEPNECNYTVSTYVNDEANVRNFNETLLYSSSDDAMIYMTIINQDALGFNGSNWDFQMIVAEDGHAGDTTVTPYYFYVELS